MLYKIFETQTEAQSYADAVSSSLPRGAGDVTDIWDIPRQTVNNQWAVASADSTGEEAPECV
jgi:hypothetical protein